MTILVDWLVAGLVVFGSFFMFVAALGVVRLPDLLTRMHAATKAGTLGAGVLLIAVALMHGDGALTTRVVAGILFLMLTAPIAAHAIGRAAYYRGVPVWEKTAVDELRGRYPAAEGEQAPIVKRPAGGVAS
jgi:multicomponent Na+:H+ antiporter subunit G